jgi:hypothetical protein
LTSGTMQGCWPLEDPQEYAHVFDVADVKDKQGRKMTTEAMSRLEAAIAASAAVRDEMDQKARDEQTAKARRLERARAIWSVRREELSGIVTKIDGLLKRHGYAGLVLGKFDQKHSDIDRAVIEFRHSTYSSSKILLCATPAGEFACSISSIDGDVGSTEMELEDLTQDRLEEAVSHAVMECLGGKRIPRPD